MTKKKALFLAYLPGTALFAMILRVIGFGFTENSKDAFYHIRIASEGAAVYLADRFPAASMSVWCEHFADKELLFHVLLDGLNRVRILLHLPEFPFLFQSFVLWLFLAGAFLFALHAFRLDKWAFLVLFLPALDAVYCNRMLMLRPLVLSSALVVFLTAGAFSLRKKPLYVLLFSAAGSMVYALTYSNPHFFFCLALAEGAFLFLLTGYRKSAVFLPLGAGIGLFAGVLIHPCFPRVIDVWILQGYTVPMLALGENPPVLPSMEMRHTGIDLARFLILFWLFSAGIFLLAFRFLKGHDLRKRLFFHPEIALLLPLFTLLFAGVLRQHRVIEYALPVGILAFGVLLKQTLPERFPVRRTALAVLILCTVSTAFVLRNYCGGGLVPFTQMAEYAKKNIPSGTRIANLEWADGGTLYYSMPDYRFSNMIETFFGYIHAPEASQKIDLFLRFPEECYVSQEELFRLTKAEYIMLPGDEFGVRRLKLLMRNGEKNLVYAGRDGFLLKNVFQEETQP